MIPVKVAIIDLNNNVSNLSIPCIKAMLAEVDRRFHGVPVIYTHFETRYLDEIPDLTYDVYISSGGPGSPFDGEGTSWEKHYFEWLNAVWNYNQRVDAHRRKHVFFICHSFQMMTRFFELGEISQRYKESFGIYEVAKTDIFEPTFAGLDSLFPVADFRKWQVTSPNETQLEQLGAEIIAIEKERPHVPFERAMMGIRLSPEMIGTQFHPEAHPPGMKWHFEQPERRKAILENYSTTKYQRVLDLLDDENYLDKTYHTILPFFLRNAIEVLRPEEQELFV